MDAQHHFHYSLKDLTPKVVNQRDDGICLSVALEDMVRTSWVVRGHTKLRLSPQAFLDANFWTKQQTVKFAESEMGGFETCRTYPFTRIHDSTQVYQLNSNRFWVSKITGYETSEDKRQKLIHNFFQDDLRYPAVGVLRMGQFGDFSEAKKCAVKGKFYSEIRPKMHPADVEGCYGGQHAVLITGINTESHQPKNHYCEVKNSWGPEWGKNGFSNIDRDLFDYVLIPTIEKRLVTEKLGEALC